VQYIKYVGQQIVGCLYQVLKVINRLKLWNMRTKKLEHDLPGHADEIYSVDWSPDGQSVASGGKDRVLKLWKN